MSNARPASLTSLPPNPSRAPVPGQALRFHPRAAVFADGDALSGVHELVSGTVALSKLLPDGRRQIVEMLRGGDLLNSPGQTVADTDAEALTEVTLRRFPFAAVAADAALQQRLAAGLGSQLARMRTHALLLGRKSAEERVAQFLMFLVPGHPCEHCRESGVDEAAQSVELVMTRQEVADYLGLTIETVSRAFSDLKRRRIIDYGRQDSVGVGNPRRLCDLAGCDLASQHDGGTWKPLFGSPQAPRS